MMKGKADLTPAQRLVWLFMQLEEGMLINPTTYAREHGLTRQAVHHEFDLLSGMGIPVVRISQGKWALMKYAEKFGWADE